MDINKVAYATRGYIHMSEKHRKLIYSNCLDCNKEISFRKNQLRIRCRQCYLIFLKKETHVSLQCSYCNTEILKKKSVLANSRHQKYFCNRLCKEKAQSLSGNCKEIRPNHYGLSNGKELCGRLVEEKGICCGCNENKKFLLQVHHIDGNREHNTLDNLEVVCSNCHIKRHLKFIDNAWIYDTKFITPRESLTIL
jgi:hypothetical protein